MIISDFSWSDETVLTINDTNVTRFPLENLVSQCRISLSIQARNRIGLSAPSESIEFDAFVTGLFSSFVMQSIDIHRCSIIELRQPPSNVDIVEISSKSVTISWQVSMFHFLWIIITLFLLMQYPFVGVCNSSSLEFIIDLIKHGDSIKNRLYRHTSTRLTIYDLQSFTSYIVIIHARNEWGSSPKSIPLLIQTTESGECYSSGGSERVE